MKRLIYKLFFLSVLFIGLTACDDQDETEYWLPGTWAGTVGNRDASFQFNENRTGSFRIEGGDSGTFDWYFEDERYWTASSGTIILDFGRGDKACMVHTQIENLFQDGIIVFMKTIWMVMMTRLGH